MRAEQRFNPFRFCALLLALVGMCILSNLSSLSAQESGSLRDSSNVFEHIDIPEYNLTPGTTLFVPPPVARSAHPPLFFLVSDSFPRTLPVDISISLEAANDRRGKEHSYRLRIDNSRGQAIAPVIPKSLGIQVDSIGAGFLITRSDAKAARLPEGRILLCVVRGPEQKAQNMFLVSFTSSNAAQGALTIPMEPVFALRERELKALTNPERLVEAGATLRAAERLLSLVATEQVQGDSFANPKIQKKTAASRASIDRYIDSLKKSDGTQASTLRAVFDTFFAAVDTKGERPSSKGQIARATRVFSVLSYLVWDRSLLAKEEGRSDTSNAGKTPHGEGAASTTGRPSSSAKSSAPALSSASPGNSPTTWSAASKAGGLEASRASGLAGSGSRSPQPQPTVTFPPAPPPSTGPCPRFSPKVEVVKDSFHLRIEWQTFHQTYRYRIKFFHAKREANGEYQKPYVPDGPAVFETERSELPDPARHVFQEQRVPHEGVFLVSIAEQAPGGGFTEECKLVEVEVPCPAFREPEVLKDKGQIAENVAFRIKDLKIANANRVLIYQIAKPPPPLEPEDEQRYTSAENKACDRAKRLDDSTRPSLPLDDEDNAFFLRKLVDEKGPFVTYEEIAFEALGTLDQNHLVCVYLCPYCGTTKRFHDVPDAGFVSTAFIGKRKHNSSTDPAFAPQSSSELQSVEPFIGVPGGRVSPVLEWQIRIVNKATGGVAHNLTKLPYPFVRLPETAPGSYGYAWRRRENSGFSPWSPESSFTIKIPGVTLNPPAQVVFAPPLISWNSTAADKKTRYEIQIARADKPSTLVVKGEGLRETSFQVPTSIPYGRYLARVRRWQGRFAATWSQFVSFELSPRIAHVTGMSAGQTPTIYAEMTQDPDDNFSGLNYEFNIQIGNSLLKRIVNKPSFTISQNLKIGSRLTAVVRVLQGKTPLTAWSKPRTLTVRAPVDKNVPLFLTPMGRFTGSTQPDFAWTYVEGAEKYELEIASEKDGSKLAREEVARTTFKPSARLPLGEVITVRVRSFGNGWGEWSPAMRYTVTEDSDE